MKRNKAWATGLVGLLLLTGVVHGQPVRSPELNVQYHRAETAWRSGASILEAKARLDRVLRALPDDGEARKLRAQVLLAMDRPEEALHDARRAVEIRPDDGEAYLILCEAARLTGHDREALAALDAAAERVLEDAAFHLRLSWNATLLGQTDKAEAFARIALALNPTEAAAYYQLARIFVRQERLDDAAAVLARGLHSSILDPAAVRKDETLGRLADHALLEGLLH